MVLNKLPEHGSLNSTLLYLDEVLKHPELIIPCLFIILLESLIILLIYVDDILVTDSNSSHVFSFIFSLHSSFALWDLSLLNYFLRVEVFHVGNSLHLN